MITAILLIIFAISTFLLLYPYFIYPIALKILPSRKNIIDPNFQCSMTLQFCAYNEGNTIPEKLRNIETIKVIEPNLQILAYDDGSTDETFALLASRPDLLTVIQGVGRKGKAHGMKTLTALATGEVLVFSDANVILETEAISELRKYYADSTIGGVCGTLKYCAKIETTTASVGKWYWRLEERIKTQESRTGNVMGADGSIFSLRRKLYPNFPDTVLDDLTVSMEAIFSGHRLIKAEDVIAFENLVTSRNEELKRKTRIAARAYHTDRYLKPKLSAMSTIDRFKYFSHKRLRWFGFISLITCITSIFALALILLKVTAAVAMATVMITILLTFSRHIKICNTALEIILSLIAANFGALKAMRGHIVSTWSPAKSR